MLSKSTVNPGKRAGTAALILALVICFILAFCAFEVRDFQNTDYDEGVYLTTFQSVQRGFPLYQQTYMSQPPAFYVLVFPLYEILGSTLESARMSVFLYSLVGVLALVWLGWELRSRVFGFIALCALYSIPLYFNEIVTLHSDSLPATFSTLALAAAFRFRNSTRWPWLVLSSICVGIAFLIKADVTGLPAIGLLLLYMTLSAKKSAGFLLKMLALFSAALLATVLLLTLPFGIRDVVSNVVQLRLQAAKGASADPSIFWSYFKVQSQLIGVLCVGLCLSAIAFVVRKTARLPIALLFLWMLTTFGALLIYRPLMDHHLVFLVVPVCAYCAYALSALLTHPALNTVWVVRVVYGLVIVAVVATLINRLQFATVPYGPAADSIQQAGIEIVKAHTQPGDYIVSDEGIITGLTQRATPPWLVDLSFVRIQSGSLHVDDFVENLEIYHPKMILVWTGRLPNLPGFERIMAQFDYHALPDVQPPLQAYLIDTPK
jgi:4-amino-4-deoxy-L-arabinose transferase-like glycosyltransferase